MTEVTASERAANDEAQSLVNAAVTVAQILAAIFAILAGFGILRLQSTDAQIQAFAKIIADLPITAAEHEDWTRRLRDGEFRDFQQRLRTIQKPQDDSEADWKRHLDWASLAGIKIERFGAIRRHNIWFLGTVSWLTALVIAGCLTLLAFLDHVRRRARAWRRLVLAAGVVCILLYAALVHSILASELRWQGIDGAPSASATRQARL